MLKKLFYTVSIVGLLFTAAYATDVYDSMRYLGVFNLDNGASPIVIEGATRDAYETTIAVTDPTADRTLTLPNLTGTFGLILGTGASVSIPSTLSTNGVDVANSIWGGTGTIIAEGSTADGDETTISFADPTEDKAVVFANASGTVMLSSLATNGPNVANSVWGVSGGLAAEGSTADGDETTVSFADPTEDRAVVFADSSGTVMLSSLSTNGQNVANGVWGGSNSIVFEGATANAFETTMSATDPTADRSITIPNATGTIALTSGAGSYATFTVDTTSQTLTTANCGEIHGMGTDVKTYTLPATAAGCRFVFFNTGAAGNNNIQIDPNASDKIVGTATTSGASIFIVGADGEMVINASATSRLGDSITLIGDGDIGWYILTSTGIWAEASP